MLTSARALLTRTAPRFLALSSCRYVQYDCFADRHIGPSDLEKRQMLDYLGFKVSVFFCISYAMDGREEGGGGQGGSSNFIDSEINSEKQLLLKNETIT